MIKIKKQAYLLAAVLAAAATAGLPASLQAKADEPLEDRYYDAPMTAELVTTTETVNFTTREVPANITTVNNVPKYYQYSNLPNSCGATAGAIIIGFYDKYFENLIPDYSTYYTATGKYKIEDDIYIEALKEDLYTLMRTNVDDVGVSRSDCLNGLSQYATQQGYTLSYTCLKSTASSSFNQSGFINAINNNQPVLLFCNEAKMVEWAMYDTYDEFLYYSIASNHVMVGYGFYQMSYYDENGTLFRTDSYMRVMSGLDGYSTTLASLNDTSWLNGVYAVDIN